MSFFSYYYGNHRYLHVMTHPCPSRLSSDLRPCLFPEHTVDANGKIRVTYPQQLVKTPLEKLQSLPARARSLKHGVTLQELLMQIGRASCRERVCQYV